MSRIGNKPIKLEDTVSLEIKGDVCIIKGKEGSIEIPIPPGIKVENKNATVVVRRQEEDKKTKSLHGLIRTLLKNAVLGVSYPWKKKLEVVGTGYKVKKQGEDLVFELGYSHPVKFEGVEGIDLTVSGKNKVLVSGINKQKVGEVANRIKNLKKPDPYKGKGIRYEGEKLKLKPGKQAKGLGELK